MSKQEDFYVGWKDQMAKSGQKFLKKKLIPIYLALPILVFVIVIFQRPFNNFRFELGTINNLTGIYYSEPFPMLAISSGTPTDLQNIDVLLVGYGKFGATGTMESIQSKLGNLNGKKITLAGTIIQGNGKTLLELTQGEESLIEVHTEQVRNNTLDSPAEMITLTGEVLDPKCYFGVMKPGEGKIHKSCAIRCISGGIPPVFRHGTGDIDDPYMYYLLVDQRGNKVNKAILPYVAEQISISGSPTQYLSWRVLYADMATILKVH